MLAAKRSVERGLGAILVLAVLGGCASDTVPVGPDGAEAYRVLTPAAMSAAPQIYTLRPGDVVSVNVFGEPELSSEEITLDNAGNIAMPLIGHVEASGLAAAELAAKIETAYGARFLRNPQVSVTVRQSRAATVTVEGEVEQPGSFAYEPGSTLLIALAQARSPTETAALKNVLVFRTVDGERMGGRFDVEAIRAGRMPDLALVPGDVIVVGHSARRAAMNNVLRYVPLLGVFRPI
ncbi:polysaccharide biosynthesis/export family protein [Qipengyuania atrilutea]|uniref:Polysaccharide export protein n=1 Tax=Qipengyuania atrilutea TaxID=2744473 RepID=A0A850H0S2_9SPHN|nr:polysaccharide biosynthesis/export family protein [Actirhodobacter atriluteus]NVD43543.1 polysaccharide export protein [Actirhodobacter atriluteus]